MVVDRLAPNIGPGPHAALLNNLGAATPLEMSVLAEELTRSRIGEQVRWLVGPAPLNDLARHEGVLGLADAGLEGPTRPRFSRRSTPGPGRGACRWATSTCCRCRTV